MHLSLTSKGRLAIILIAALLLLWGYNAPADAALSAAHSAGDTESADSGALALTEEEQAYIKSLGRLRAMGLRGTAPLCYEDYKGRPRGISWEVTSRVAELIGLEIEMVMLNSITEADNTDYDLVVSVSPNYARGDTLLSRPYLSTSTIIYLNDTLKSDQLQDKIFAAIGGAELPEGISPDKAKYYSNRAESMAAVNRGEADYAYGNAFSVNYYTLHRNFDRLLTVPLSKELRQYSIGVARGDALLLGIIDKALSSIDEEELQRLILTAMANSDQMPSPSLIFRTYRECIYTAAFVIFTGLSLSVVGHIQMNRQLRVVNKRLVMLNSRHERLAALSNEYFYEYFLISGWLKLSEPTARLLKSPEAVEAIKVMLRQLRDDGHTSTLILPLQDGGTGVFRAIHAFVYDEAGQPYSVVGKLLDISADTAEKKRLILESQTDGLTGLYNATTARELITRAIEQRLPHHTSAMLLMDCDNFKDVNDTHGHLTGDKLLANLAKCLREVFGRDNIIGRMGGDEFGVYIKNAPSAAEIESLCHSLRECIKAGSGGITTTVSIGVVLTRGTDGYETLFKMADSALYDAKGSGKDRMVLYDQRYSVFPQ